MAKSAKELLERYKSGRCTPEEKLLVEDWFLKFGSEEEILISLHNLERVKSEMWEVVQTHRNQPIKINLWPRIAAAASIIFCLSAGGYFLLHEHPRQQTAQNQKQDISPGTNRAILTLANGKKVIVTGASNGILAKQANMIITKSAGSQLSYQQQNTTATVAPLMNTLSTPLGAESSITLSDGTIAKLDAGSSITFPVNFTGHERRVTITGQVYFKVKHNASRPFYVTAGSQTIADVGTEFNIDAYEQVKTTLIQGKVTVNGKTLIPGQEAVSKNSNLTVEQGDPEEAAAWTNGYFRFNDENIESIMRQLSRWYNVEVVYLGGTSKNVFNGKISRYKNISQVLNMLAYSQTIHFKVEGRRVTVIR